MSRVHAPGSLKLTAKYAGDLGHFRDAFKSEDRVGLCCVSVLWGTARDEPHRVRLGQNPDQLVP